MFLIVFSLMAGAQTAFAAADGGQPGEFLRQEPAARGAGLGGAMAAVVDDASALIWNPAGLARLVKPEVDATHVVLFEDTSWDFLAGAWPGKQWGSFAAGLVRQTSGNFERRSGPSDAAVGFSISQQALLAGWGKSFGPFDVGAALKSVKETVDTASGSGAGADAGAIYHYDGRFSVGLLVQNLVAPTVTFASEPQRYPRELDLSPAYAWRWGDEFGALAALDLRKVAGESLSPGGGLELTYRRLAAARFGVQDKGLTTGVGLRFGNTSFDYAALLADLGVSHVMTFTQRFGQTREELEETIRRGISQLTASEAGRLAKAYERRAQRELSDNNLADALHDLESASLLDPKDDQIHEEIRKVGAQWEAQLKRQMVERAAEMAAREQESGNLLASRSYWRNVLELDPENARARDALARIDGLLSAEDRKRLESARQAQEQADDERLIVAATALTERGAWRQAVEEAKKGLDERPDSETLKKFFPGLQAGLQAFVAAKSAAADKLAAQGDLAGALREAEAGLHEQPENAALGKRAAAWRAELRKRASPENRRKAEQLYYQAVEQYLKGDFKAADALADQVMALDPGSEAARGLKDKVEAALRYAR